METTPAAPTEGAPKRPIAITIICVIGFIGSAFAIPLIFTDLAASVGAWYPPFLAASAGVGFASMGGMWMMRKWGVYLYAALTALAQVVMAVMGVWTVGSVVIPGAVIAIGFANLAKMR